VHFILTAKQPGIPPGHQAGISNPRQAMNGLYKVSFPSVFFYDTIIRKIANQSSRSQPDLDTVTIHLDTVTIPPDVILVFTTAVGLLF